jgi:hypothetical protein
MIRYTAFACILLGALIYGTACHDEKTEIPRVEELQFVNKKINLKINERQAVKINVKPTEAKKYHTVEFNASVEGYISISETSNDGCVITGEKSGTVVLIARADGYTAYLEVTVDGGEIVQAPYIQIPTQVVEVLEGARKTVQVNLFNGSAIDQQLFQWAVEPGKDIISISPTGNTVVIQGEKRGSQKIIVTHELSEYPAEILVFVLGAEERVNYITTAQNVIQMIARGENKQFSATLVNGAPTDTAGFSFKILEEDPCIDILSSNNSCNVMAKWKGTAVIRIGHPLAEYPLDVRVIVLDGQETYIELDRTFVLMDIGQGDIINASMGGVFKESWNADFSYTLKGDEDCIQVSQTNFSFYATAVKNGKCIIEIANKNIQYSKEALIVVREEVYVPPDEYYITTSQNVIQLEIGQKIPTQLNIQLINGNEADKASFEWMVDDGRIIDVDALDLPSGKSVKYETRSIRNRAQAEIKQVANTLALVTPKKTGMARIVISHPKSGPSATVICKVYPRGTFANQPFILEADEPKTGLIKVDTTMQAATGKDTLVKLKMASGDINDVGNLDWKLNDTALAGLQDMKRLENYIHGKSKGVTKLVVENMNLKNPYEATVIVGTTEELAKTSALYVDQVYQTVAAGQSISVQIKNSGEDAELMKSDQYTVGMYDKTKFIATMVKSRLLIQGLAETASGLPVELTIGNSSSPEIYPVRIFVTVVPGEITISKPYTISGPNFIGMNYGMEKEVKVVLADATAVEKDGVVWSSENAAIVKVTGNGEIARFKAGNTASQTNITASHSKSQNDKIIVAYVVPPGADPEKAVVLGIEKDHWLLKTGDEIILSLITNANETADMHIRDIKWSVDDAAVAAVDYSGSRALVTAKKAGSMVITVTHPKNVINLKIYVSVSDMPALDRQITLPSIVEMIIGENKVVTAVTQGLYDVEIKGINWSIEDSKVIGISGEGAGLTGGKVFLQGRDKGQSWLTARQDSFGYQKKILVVCARSYEELMNTYVMASEESYYRLKVGESRDIRLMFGSAGFPEDKRRFITWKDEGNKVVKIYDGNGNDHAKIEAVALGITTVTADHKDVLKPVIITFETYTEPVNVTNFVFKSNTLMMGLVVKKPADPENDDNTKVLKVSIDPAGPSFASMDAVDENPSSGIFTFGKAGGDVRITAAAKGQSYLKISHPQVAEDLRVLIYAADSKAELDNMFPIALSKPNYLLTIGDPISQYIKIETPPESSPGYADKIKKISWAIDNTRIVDYTINANKKEVRLDGRNAGNCVFDIKYDNVVVEKAYVSVRSAAMDMNKKIVTESIIGLKTGQEKRKTSVGSNLTTEEKKKLEWKTLNPGIVSISPLDGDFTSQWLTPVAPGETEVVVTFDKQIERNIKVYVSADINAYKAVNLDTRYYQLRKNDEMTITAFHAALPCSLNDIWDLFPLDNHVVEMESSGKDKLKIKGINEGIATVILHNDEYAADAVPMTDVRFLIEVSNTAPKVEDVTDDWYMTAFKTVYALDPAKTQDWTRIKITGVRFPDEQLTQIKWRVKSEEIGGVKRELGENETSALIDIYPSSGTFVDVAPKNKIGKVILEASHPRSVNKSLEITVICNAAMLLANPVPHIASEKEIVKIQKYESQNFAVKIEDINESYDIGKFTVTSDNPSKVTVQVTGGQVTVRGVEFGQAMITIEHPSAPDIQKRIVVMVLTTGDLVYLTTRQNFVALEKGKYQSVEVDLVGFEDINNRNFIWSTDDWNLISINDSGRTAVITAKETAKTAKITVQHAACPEYPLYIYVRVTDKLTAKPVYITTANNIVLLKEGGSMQVKSSLVNGGAHELSQFQWSTGDRNLIELNYSGDTAMLKGIKAGTAQVAVWHPSSLNSINIIIVVEPVDPGNGIYITTDTLLVEMATTEKQRLIRARLVGGSNEDIYGFQWAVTQWKSELRKNDGGSFQVVDMNANADMCYIRPHSEGGLYFEGEAVLTVSHPKTKYKLDIKILVGDDVDIVFENAYVTINQFEQKLIRVSASSSARLNYTSTNSAVLRAEGTSAMCVIEGVGAGTAIVIASNMSGTKSAELIVNVKAVDLNNYYYLQTGTSIVTMDTREAYRTISGEVIEAKTGKRNDYLTSQLKWKIKESGQSKEIVRLNNSSDTGIVVTHDQVTLYPVKSGDIEVIFGFFDKNDPLFAQYPTLKDKCAGKTIYVRVTQASEQFVLSHAVITIKEGEAADNVWAKIEPEPPGINYGNWLNGGDIMWASEKPDVVAVIYRNDANKQSNVSLQTFKPGNAQVFVKYGTTQQIISVVVTANSFIHSDKSGFNVMPDISEIFTITSNPNKEDITMTIDSNQWVTFKYRQKGVNAAWSDLPPKFITQTGAQMAAIDPATHLPYEGVEIKVTGGVSEGTTTITFEMKKTGQKLQVMVTNVKNYFVQWEGRAQVRFAPNEPVPAKVSTNQNANYITNYKGVLRLYYKIQPAYDKLDPYQVEGKFRILPGQTYEYESDGKTVKKDKDGYEIVKERWIDFVKPYKTGTYEEQPYFGPCGMSINLRTRETNMLVPLDVYIYYDNIPVSWVMDRAEYYDTELYRPGTGSQWSAANLKSTYDAVNYSATIGSNEKLYIKFNIDGDYPGHGLTMRVANLDIQAPSQADINQTGDRIIISWDPPPPGTTTVSAYIKDTTFLYLLKVEYSYFNGFKEPVKFYRNILVYGANVIRKL